MVRWCSDGAGGRIERTKAMCSIHYTRNPTLRIGGVEGRGEPGNEPRRPVRGRGLREGSGAPDARELGIRVHGLAAVYCGRHGSEHEP